MSANGYSAIYTGKVRHRRFAPTQHAFTYRLHMAYFDLGELEAVAKRHPLWSVEKNNVISLRRKDHFGAPERSLSECVRDLVEKETGRRPGGRICLLTNPRYLGYVFNPVSFYYCYDKNGENVEAIVAEVSNTPWLERHCYVLQPETGGSGVMKFAFEKEFHVSPFFGMEQDYAWSLSPPGEKLTVHMENYEEGQKVFDATMLMTRREMSRAEMSRLIFSMPPMTFKVVSAIYWNALRLWLKRTPFHSHPAKRTEVPHS